MNVSADAIKMIQHHEGIRYKPYRCPARLWTVGVGHVLYPEQGKLPIDQRDGFALRPEDNRAFSKDEVDAIIGDMRPVAKKEAGKGFIDSADNLWKYFLFEYREAFLSRVVSLGD